MKGPTAKVHTHERIPLGQLMRITHENTCEHMWIKLIKHEYMWIHTNICEYMLIRENTRENMWTHENPWGHVWGHLWIHVQTWTHSLTHSSLIAHVNKTCEYIWDHAKTKRHAATKTLGVIQKCCKTSVLHVWHVNKSKAYINENAGVLRRPELNGSYKYAAESRRQQQGQRWQQVNESARPKRARIQQGGQLARHLSNKDANPARTPSSTGAHPVKAPNQ